MSVTVISSEYPHHAGINAPILTSPSSGLGILLIVARTRKVRAVGTDYSHKKQESKQKGRE
jgi:hypothetical protein